MVRHKSPEKLWHRFNRTHSAAVREELVAACQPVVYSVVRRFRQRFASYCTFDELVSYGYDGLLIAIEDFEPVGTASFETWLKQRVEWSIHDALRVWERWVPRSVWIRDREVQRVEFALHNKLRRSPTRFEMAKGLGWTIEKYDQQVRDVVLGEVAALDETYKDNDQKALTLLDRIANPSSPDPESWIAAQFVGRELLDALCSLTVMQQIVIVCYFGHCFTQREIGGLLDVSCSRASQLLAVALAQLRTALTTPQPRKKTYEYRSAVS